MASKSMASKRIGCALRKMCAKPAADTTYQANALAAKGDLPAKQAEAIVQHAAEIFGQGEKSVDAKLASLMEEFKRMQDHHFDKLKFEVEKQHLELRNELRNELWKSLEDRETRSREAFEDVHLMMSKHAEDLHHKVKKDLHRYYITVCGIVIAINLLKSL